MLHVIYRSTGGENLHRRPSFYGKDLALVSLLRAVADARCLVDLTFVNDGPIPAARLEVMRQHGRIVVISAGTSLLSHLAGVRIALESSWDPADLVYFVEDDYLWCPRALDDLNTAAASIQTADYFACYAKVRQQVRPVREFDVAGSHWLTAQSYTATFATRVGVLREDSWLFRLAGRCDVFDWDMAACLTYQGRFPYRPIELVSDLLGRSPGSPGRRTRLRFFLWRLVLSAASLRYRRRPRLPISCVPALATHMDSPYLAQDVDWDEVARDTHEWAASHHLAAS